MSDDADVLPDEEWVKYLTPEKRKRLEVLLAATRQVWTPQPGPQTRAYHSKAKIVGYGGAAGGGKTDLALGLALTKHQKVGIFRETGTEMTAVNDRLEQILGSRDGFNGQERIWRVKRKDGTPVQIELGSFPHPGTEKKYRGRPHDLLVFDEAADMRLPSIRFVMGWLRTADPEQRCRVLMCFNPPTKPEGRWVIKYFAPWLDKNHPNPAEPGELRWFVTVGEDTDREVPGPEPIEIEGELRQPESRTFIPSRVSDNKYYAGTDYEAQLDSLPEKLRKQMKEGDFEAGMEDDPHQVIPTEWVEAAMDRWTRPERLGEMHSIGVDVAMGGRDNTIIARRHGMWFDEPVVHPGVDCPDGPTIAGHVVAVLRDRAPIHIDLFGVGAEPYGHLMRTDVQVHGINVGDTTEGESEEGHIKFTNVRTELWWRMREALNPTADTGICLPKNQQLLADLCAPCWQMRSGKLYVESREEIEKKIGRSPDWASAYCLALLDTMKEEDARVLMRGDGAEYDPFKHI